MPQMTVVRVYVEDWKKLKNIKSKHNFPNYAETVGYILQKFPEMIVVQGEPMHIIAGNASSPIIDADQLQVVRKKP